MQSALAHPAYKRNIPDLLPLSDTRMISAYGQPTALHLLISGSMLGI